MKKKVIASGLTILAILLVLNGCSKPAEKKAEAAEKKVELRCLSWQTAHQKGDQAVADAYMKLHPNVTIKYEYYGDQNSTEYLKKIDIMVMGGEEMDVIMTPSFALHAQRAASGTYVDMTPYFQKEGVDPSKAYVIYPAYDGKTYSMPGDWKAWFVVINKDYLDEAGLPTPPLNWTWDDYRAYAKKLTKGSGEKKRYGSYFHVWSAYNEFGLWSQKTGNMFFNANGEPDFDNEMYRKWFQFRYDLENVDKSQVPYADVTGMKLNYRAKFFNGEVAMLPTGTFLIPELDDQDKFPHTFATVFAPIPAWPGSEPGSTFSDAHYYSISKTSKHPQETYDYLRFYTTEGMKIKADSVTCVAGENKLEFIKSIIDDQKYYDMPSLDAYLNNPAWKTLFWHIMPSYQAEFEKIINEEAEKFYLGKEKNLNVITKTMQDRALDVVKTKGGK